VKFNSLSTAKNYPGGAIRATFSGDFTALVNGDVRTITLTGSSGQNRHVPEPVIVESPSSLGFFTREVTTAGRDGFSSGQYDIHAYALVYRDVHTQNGKIATELL
jgi:hypothetical protein